MIFYPYRFATKGERVKEAGGIINKAWHMLNWLFSSRGKRIK